MKEYKKVLVVTAVGAVLFCGALMSVAYNTDSGSLQNNVYVARADISVVEEEYDKLPDDNGNGIKDCAEELVQGKEITKDPVIMNNSNLGMYCFASVEVPVRTVMTVAEAPSKSKTELFAYHLNEGWVKLEESETPTSKKVLYGYKEQVAPKAKTKTLFDKVKYANVVEGEIPQGEVLTVDVKGYAIQATGFNSMEEALEAFDWNQSAMSGGN